METSLALRVLAMTFVVDSKLFAGTLMAWDNCYKVEHMQ